MMMVMMIMMMMMMIIIIIIEQWHAYQHAEIIAVCPQIHTKHINTQCGQNVELLNVKTGGTYSNHWALKG
jgi:hypothetical protein